MRTFVLFCHGVLLVAVCALILNATLPGVWRAGWLVVAAAPLALAVPGLLRGHRYTRQWLAIVLVVYIGAAATEIIAAGARTPAATAALLAALAELALLLMLLRNRRDTRG